MVTILAFVVLGGGTALGAYVVSSNSQVGPGTIRGHKPPTGKHANIIANSINGKDIADRSGVDTCKTPLVKKFGPICAGSDAGARTWGDALFYCRDLGLRLPSLSEAVALGKNYDVPGVSGSQYFWTNDQLYIGGFGAESANDSGGYSEDGQGNLHQTVCVTDPSA
jgi:hypothetical protein